MKRTVVAKEMTVVVGDTGIVFVTVETTVVTATMAKTRVDMEEAIEDVVVRFREDKVDYHGM
jgi:hypothetical protein